MGTQLFFAESLVGVLQMFFKKRNGEFFVYPKIPPCKQVGKACQTILCNFSRNVC